MDHFDQSGLRFWVRPPLAPEEANSCDALCLLQLSIRRNLLSSSSVGSDPTAQPSPPPPSSLLLLGHALVQSSQFGFYQTRSNINSED